MNTWRQYILVAGTSTAVALVAFSFFGNRPAVRAAEGDQFEYTFGRPLEKGERTYDWYRTTHADAAAKRYGVDPAAVGDGMDTWHWWTGIDNPGFWRQLTILTTGKHKLLDVRIDLLQTLKAVGNNWPH